MTYVRPAAAPRRPAVPHSVPPSNRRRLLPWLVVAGITAFGLMMAAGMAILLLVGMFGEQRISAGVSVAGLSFSNQPLDTARTQLEQYAARPVTLTDADRSWQLSLADLGVHVDVESTLKSVKDARPNSHLVPRYTVDLNQTQNALFALSDQVNIAAVPGNPPQYGRAMEIPVTLSRLQADVAGELTDGVLELDMIEVEPPPSDERGRNSSARVTHVVEAGQELALIARQYGVDMQDILTLNDISNPDLLYIGQELTIPAAGLYSPTQADAPAAPTNAGKSILVSTGDQRIYAYENGQLVHSHLASTGRYETPTVLGDFAVYVKYTADDMSGPGYFLPQVPYTMYFYSGYAIHGTYWHNSFGRRMSHGCVNLPTNEAQWFFNWAEVGTPVRVI
ncbi:MAG: L,D-transpeptidase family protein [Anaerolineae bacterium]